MQLLVRMALCFRDGGGQFGEALAAHCHSGDHRHAECLGQGVGIEHQPVPLGQIDHVERDHRWAPQFEDFLREDEMLFEIGSVEDDDQHVRRAFALEFARHDIARHCLVRACGIEAVGAGQVEQFDGLAPSIPGRQSEAPCLTLDRDAGIIGDLLARAGQGVEQRALAGIGIADQRGAAQPCGGGGRIIAAHAVAPASTSSISMAAA